MIRKKILLILLPIILLLNILLPVPTALIFANTFTAGTVYTNVLDDLKNDRNFNVSDYSTDISDFSLEVIQIAESANNELFVYVFSPGGLNPTTNGATSINMAIDGSNMPNYSNYSLKLLNVDGSFAKYVVDKFKVSNATMRYYEISSIFRAYDPMLDPAPTGDNTISEVSFVVGKLYTFQTTENGIVAGCRFVDVITVTDKYVGFVRYEDGFTGNMSMGIASHSPGFDSHFIAFRTDRPIDKLMTADVVYKKQSYSYSKSSTLINLVTVSEKEKFGNIVDCTTQLTDKDHVALTVPHGFHSGNSYEWDRIQTVDNFIETETRSNIFDAGIFSIKNDTKITDTALNQLKEKQWVLRFAETDYSNYYTNPAGTGSLAYEQHVVKKTIVSDVSILRLTFETDNQYYCLGVVDNKQTGSTTPSNETITTVNVDNGFLTILKIFLAILLLVLVFVFLSYIMPFISAIYKFFSNAFYRLKGSTQSIKKQAKKNGKKRGRKK